MISPVFPLLIDLFTRLNVDYSTSDIVIATSRTVVTICSHIINGHFKNLRVLLTNCIHVLRAIKVCSLNINCFVLLTDMQCAVQDGK